MTPPPLECSAAQVHALLADRRIAAAGRLEAAAGGRCARLSAQLCGPDLAPAESD